MRIDSQVIHSDDVKPGDGAELYGTPVREVNLLDVEVREELDMQARARLGLGVDAVPAELLPGEVITDNVIRRSTTAEVVGDTFYQPQTTEQGIADLKDPDYWDDYTARCV